MAADVRNSIAQWSISEGSNLPLGSTAIGTNLDENLRMIQAAVRAQFEDAQWMDFGDFPTFISANTFSVPGNQTTRYHVNRRVKLFGSGMGTLYGVITASSFGSVTSVTVALDTGAITANLSVVSASVLTFLNPAIPRNFITAAQVPSTAANGVAATNVDAAIAELGAEKANVASPAFTGNPTAPTAPAGTNTTQLATTAFVAQATSGLGGGLAPLISPNFSGTPTAPTPTAGNNTTQIATTAFVQNAVSGVSGFATVDQIQNGSVTAATAASISSNAITVTLSPAPSTYANGNMYSFFVSAGNTGAVTINVNGLGVRSLTKHGTTALVSGDIVANKVHIVRYDGTQFQLINPGADSAGGAPLNSPAFTGVPTAPTASVGTNTTQLATTAFVNAEVASDIAASTAVVHTTGTETVGGAKTFTSIPVISASVAGVALRDTNLAVNSGGLWRWIATGDALIMQRNTSAGGDFATSQTAMTFNANSLSIGGSLTVPGNAVVTGTVTAASATAAAHLVTKAQLDNKSFGLVISNNGSTASIVTGPPGWSVTRTGVGAITVTHNLGTSFYAAHAGSGVGGGSINAAINSASSSAFNVNTANAGAATDISTVHVIVVVV